MALKTKLALIALLTGSAATISPLWAQTPPVATGEAPAADTATDATTDAAVDAAADAATDTAPAADASTDEAAAEPAEDAAASGEPAADADAAPSVQEVPGAAPAPGSAAAPASSPEEAQLGAFYVEETHGDWTLRCQKLGGEVDPCELYQLMRDQQDNPVAEISLIPIEGEAVAGATLVAPLETDLIPGIGLRIDSGEGKAYPFSFCAQVGCVSRIGFTQSELDAMRRGKSATVTVKPFGVPADQRVDLDLSLTGFTAGWDALKARPEPSLPEPAAPEAAAADTDADEAPAAAD